MSAHTPGPWEVCHTNNGTFVKSKRVAGYLAEVRHCRATQDVKADARLIAAAPELLEALHVVSECGDPCKVSLYDEEGIEGWRWTHPDGREWEEVGEWCEGPPLHPVARAAIAKATGEQP